MESLLPEGIRQLASQGTGWLVSCFLAAALVWCVKRLLEAQQKCAEQAQALQEKRVEETQRTVSVQHDVATALAELAAGMKDRTLSLDTLTSLVKQMTSDMAANGVRWQDRVKGIEGTLADIARRVEDAGGRLADIQRRLP